MVVVSPLVVDEVLPVGAVAGRVVRVVSRREWGDPATTCVHGDDSEAMSEETEAPVPSACEDGIGGNDEGAGAGALASLLDDDDDDAAPFLRGGITRHCD